MKRRLQQELAGKKDKRDPEPRTEGAPFLTGLKCYVHPANFGAGRLKILQNLVRRHGGNVVGTLPEISNELHYIIFEESVSSSQLDLLIDQSRLAKVLCVSCTWLIECVKVKRKVETDIYEINSLDKIESARKIEREVPQPYVHEGQDKTEQNRTTNCDEDNARASQKIPPVCKPSISNERELAVTYNMLVSLPSCSTVEGSKSEGECCGILSAKKEKCMETEKMEKSETVANEDDTLQALVKPIPKSLQDKFACARPSSSRAKDVNAHITVELDKLATTYKSKNDTWRAHGYQKAISAIRNYPKEITSREEALKIPGVGERLADKVAEILESGRLQKVAEVCEGEEAETLKLFMGVWGAGPSTAQAWYTQVRKAAGELVHGLVVEVCGSYRRGKPTCGDVDILITHPDGCSHEKLFRPLLTHLKQSGFLTDDLVYQEQNGNQQKYLGVCRLPGKERKHRRLDIIVVPYAEFAPAIMYFTGSAHFNRSMRLLATKKGMSLSEHGLRVGIVRQGREKLNEGQLLDTPSEESIFTHLGLQYRPPQERDH